MCPRRVFYPDVAQQLHAERDHDADDRRFFYGTNFEFSYSARRWDQTRFTSRTRPIVGWHVRPFDVIVNPIVDTAYDGFKSLEFVTVTRVAYNASPRWAIGLEEYADFGPVRKFFGRADQAHQLYAVVNRTGGPFDVEAAQRRSCCKAPPRTALAHFLREKTHHD